MLSVYFILTLLIVKAVVSCYSSHLDCSLCMLTSQMAVQRDCLLHGCYIIYYLCFYVTFSFLKSDDEITELGVKHGCPL